MIRTNNRNLQRFIINTGIFLWYVANQKLQDAHLAEDAVQEFSGTDQTYGQNRGVHSDRARNFLATFVRSKAVGILRKKVPEAELPEEYGELKVGGDMLDHYLTKENYHRLVACVLELDDTYRTVFEYKFMYQMSDAEIADVMGISAKNVNIRYFRARKKLQEMIRKEVQEA